MPWQSAICVSIEQTSTIDALNDGTFSFQHRLAMQSSMPTASLLGRLTNKKMFKLSKNVDLPNFDLPRMKVCGSRRGRCAERLLANQINAYILLRVRLAYHWFCLWLLNLHRQFVFSMAAGTKPNLLGPELGLNRSANSLTLGSKALPCHIPHLLKHLLPKALGVLLEFTNVCCSTSFGLGFDSLSLALCCLCLSTLRCRLHDPAPTGRMQQKGAEGKGAA